MLSLLQQASCALAVHDAVTLERLAADAASHLRFDPRESEAAVISAVQVLSAQLKAARMHLALPESGAASWVL